MRERLVSFFRQFLAKLQIDQVNELDVKVWEQLAIDIGALEQSDERLARIISHNVCVAATAAQDTAGYFETHLSGLTSSLQRMLVQEDNLHLQRKRRCPPSPSPSDHSLFPSSTSTPLSSAPSSPNTSALPLPIPREPSDHIREWFLDHLASPFPTSDEKMELSRLTGIARPKIDSDLTNWRRRTGWTDVRNKYGNGDKEKTKEVIENVLNGEDDREDLIEAVEKMKSYLKREREFAAGDWIKKLKPAVNLDRAPKGKKRLRTSKTIDRPPTPPSSTDVSPDISFSTESSSLLLFDTPPASLRSTSGSSYTTTSSSFSFKPYSFQAPTPASSSTSHVGIKRSNESLISQDEQKPSVKPRLDTFTGTYEDPGWVVPIHHTSPDQYMLLPDPSCSSQALEVYPEQVWWSSTSAMPPMLDHMVAPSTGVANPFVLPEQYAFNFEMAGTHRST